MCRRFKCHNGDICFKNTDCSAGVGAIENRDTCELVYKDRGEDEKWWNPTENIQYQNYR